MGITNNQSPAVMVHEFDLTNVIEAASASAAAVVGQFNWGPVDEIKTISSETKLNAMFGVPTDTCYYAWFSAKNFLDYSHNLKIVRVADADAVNASPIASTGLNISNEEDYITNHEGTSTSFGAFAAKYPGLLGNSISMELADAATYSLPDARTFAVTDGGTTYDETDDVACLTLPAPVGGGVTATLEPIVTDGAITGVTVTEAGSGYTSADLPFVVTVAAPVGAGDTAIVSIGNWYYASQFLATPGTSDYTAAMGGTNDELHIIIIDTNGEFTGTAGTVLEKFAFASKAIQSKYDDGTTSYYPRMLRESSSYAWWLTHPTGMTNWGGVGSTDFIELTDISTHTFANGTDGTTIGDDELMAGWDLFKNKELVDVGLLISGPASNVLREYLTQNIAEWRRDCVALLSPLMNDVVTQLPGAELAQVLATRNVLSASSYSIMDCNWKYQYDAHNDTFRWLPCNADIAGICARTDYDRDPWWSPAGYNRGHLKNVVKLAWNPDKAERDELYVSGVNPVNIFTGEGAILYGDKTMLTKSSAFDRINVRRLFIVLEKSISEAAKYALFEFNDSATRLKFRLMVEPFLRQVQGGRGIVDFNVVCDETNNTAQVIMTNSFVGDIYIKPNYSINYIHLNFIATPQGLSFELAQSLQTGGIMV